LAGLEPRTFAQALFKALGLNEDDFQFGVSKVFFRPGKFAEFDTIMKSDPDTLAQLVGKVMEWLVKQRWKKLAWSTVSCLKFASKIRQRAGAAIVVQKTILMFLARRQHKPRYLGMKQMGQLQTQIDILKEAAGTLQKNKEKFEKLVDDAAASLRAGLDTIKNKESVSRDEINKMTQELAAQMNKDLGAIKKEQEKQKLAAEADRLKKLAEEMEKQRLAKEAEEAARKKQEEDAQEMLAMELLAKKEAEEEDKRLEAERIRAEKEAADGKLQKKRDVESQREEQERQALEQERRDQELAMRLAKDQANPDDALTADAKKPVARKHIKRSQTFANKKQETIHNKLDLAKWKYADLRDTINTSCDIDLLEACREEFHRRLKVYHAWKMKNTNKQDEGKGRAPPALHTAASSRGAAPVAPKKKVKAKSNERPQRYFRIPFIRPADKESGFKKKGWWFAHFDGQWIARQMELHPDKETVCLVAGRDDMEMCELSLEETGLSRKRGAEILEREFEDEWKRHYHGPEYVRATAKK